MSASVFPALPGVAVLRDVVRAPYYRTTVLETWSGREVRLARQASARVRLRLRVFFARDNVNCTVAPFTGYTELGVIKYFFDAHKGRFDSFHVADPDGGADLVVRFQDDELPLTEETAHVWSGEIPLVSVL